MLQLDLPPVSVRRHLLDAVEFLRVAAISAQQMYDAFDDDANEDWGMNSPWVIEHLCTAKAFAAMLQEHVGDVTPLMPDWVFQTVRDYRNRWPRHPEFAESVHLGLELAQRSLTTAIEESAGVSDELSPLDDMMIAARAAIEGQSSLIGNNLAAFDTDEVIEAILAGNPLQRFYTDDEVKEALLDWHKKGLYHGKAFAS